MLKTEFENAVGREVSDKNYRIIEQVYMHIPGMDKELVCKIYEKCGVLPFEVLLVKAIDNAQLEVKYLAIRRAYESEMQIYY